MSADECLMSLAKTPSYLSILLDRVEDITFIYTVANNVNSSFEIDSPQKNKTKENIGDITGSPLKVDLDTSSFSFELFDDCTNFWQKNEETYHPIPYETSK